MRTEQADFVNKTKTSRIFKAKRQILLALLLALAGSGVSLETMAQSSAQVNNSIRSLERNRDFRNLQSNSQALASIRQSLNIAESNFSRGGCQSALNARQTLSRDCRIIAQQILRERREVASLEEKVQIGQTIARQREQLLNQSGSTSSVTIINQRPPSFFEQLFGSLGGNSQTIVGGEFDPQTYGTVRSVCVRKSDGYYWPVSFSTMPQYLPNDADLCNIQCRGKEVELYYYSNPGQNPEDMINLAGQKYAALPNAFSYRTEYNLANSCNVKTEAGRIELVKTAGISRAYLAVGDTNLPLPLRDPRTEVQTSVAQIGVFVTLPRPRPNLDGEAGEELTPNLSAELRVVELNGKVIRLVGPDTPYGQSTATGS